MDERRPLLPRRQREMQDAVTFAASGSESALKGDTSVSMDWRPAAMSPSLGTGPAATSSQASSLAVASAHSAVSTMDQLAPVEQINTLMCYDIVKMLGAGQHGAVYKVTSDDLTYGAV